MHQSSSQSFLESEIFVAASDTHGHGSVSLWGTTKSFRLSRAIVLAYDGTQVGSGVWVSNRHSQHFSAQFHVVMGAVSRYGLSLGVQSQTYGLINRAATMNIDE